MAETKDKLTLGYWAGQGLAQAIRFLLIYHKVDFEDKQYQLEQASDWFGRDKSALNTDFPNLPYIQDGDVVITENLAVLQYAATKTGNKDLLGKSTFDTVKICQLYSFIGDMRTVLVDLAKNKEYEKVRDEVLNSKIAPFLTKLSKNLGENEYLLGYLTWVDFWIFTQLDVVRRMNPEFLAKWPSLEKYHARFYNNEEIKAYRNSDKYPKLWGPPAFLTWTGLEN